MNELGITVAVWSLTLLGLRSRRLPTPLRGLSTGIGREHASLFFLMLAIHARIQRTGAEDSLATPFVTETVLRGIFVITALVIIFPIARCSIQLGRTVRRRWFGILALAVYAATTVLSVSYADAPLQSGGKAFELTVLVTYVWALMSRPEGARDLRRSILFVLMLETALLATACLGFFVLPADFSAALSRPGFFFRNTMTAPFASSNSMASRGATIAAFAATVLVSAGRFRRQAAWYAIATVGLAAVALSAGRQGVVIFGAAMLLGIFVLERQAFFLVVMPAALVIALLGADAVLKILERDQVQGSLVTLTGRTTFWAAGFAAFLRRPLTGYGFGGSRFAALESIGADRFTHLHNGYLEALVGVGILGFIPLMAALVWAGRWAIRALRAKKDVEYAAILVALVLQNTIGLGFGSWLNPNLILFALLVGLADVSGFRRTAPPRRHELVPAP
jgi:O-antigen ligase